MAGATKPLESYWPQGRWVVLRLGPVDVNGDSDGYKTHDSVIVPADLYIRKAELFCQEAGITITNGINMKIIDDTGTPQTIVAERAVTASDDAGAQVALTVADEGPILAGGEIQLEIDSNTSDVAKNLSVTLWCEPRY